jgi:hypothetical protein
MQAQGQIKSFGTEKEKVRERFKVRIALMMEAVRTF